MSITPPAGLRPSHDYLPPQEPAPFCLTLELVRAEDAGDPHRFDFSHRRYLLRQEGGIYRESDFAWSAQLLENLRGLIGSSPSPELAQRLGTSLRAASADGTARVWPADGSSPPLILKGHSGSILTAAFSPDGSRVLTTSQDDRTARIWTIAPTLLLRTLHTATTVCLTPLQRQQYLGETPEEARLGYERRLRSRGQAPAPCASLTGATIPLSPATRSR